MADDAPGPRKRYPSDHRRWFRVMEDILDDPSLAGLSLADLGLLMKLRAVLNRQKSRDGSATIDRFTACALAKRERWAYAKPAFDRLAARGLVNVVYGDDTVTYLDPKWAETQGFTPSELPHESTQNPRTTPTPKTTPSNPPISPPFGDERPVAASAAPSRTKRSSAMEGKGSRKPEVPFPEPFPDEMRSKLYAWGSPQGFDAGQVDFALEAIGIKSRARGYRNRDWYAACQGYIRAGWPLHGYQDGVGGSALQNVMLAIEASRSREREQLAASASGREAAGHREPVLDLLGDEARPRDARSVPGRTR